MRFIECDFTENEYDRMWRLYKKGVITAEEWNEYCFEMLEHLMKLNKKVLDNLKNN